MQPRAREIASTCHVGLGDVSKVLAWLLPLADSQTRLEARDETRPDILAKRTHDGQFLSYGCVNDLTSNSIWSQPVAIAADEIL